MPNYSSWSGRTAYDKDNNKVGTIADLYYDDDANVPSWATVKSGLFGTKVHFAPLKLAQETDDGVKFNVASDLITNAPSVEVDEELSEEDEGLLFQHYLSQGDTSHAATDQGHDTSGPNTDEAMTRSEEQLHVGKERQEVGRARLKKYIVTEEVHTTVPLQREVVRLEREPITDENREQATSGADLTEEEHEVVLTEERAVVSKETVPVERIKLAKDVITEDQAVDETIRKEQIDAGGSKAN